MSMLSYAGGSRFLQLLGGVVMSFYDWYCDLPPASPEIWGEQTDVAESADWYNSKYIVAMGSNVAMTRTPDAHFLSRSALRRLQAGRLLAGLQPGGEARRLVGAGQRRAGWRVLDGGRITSS